MNFSKISVFSLCFFMICSFALTADPQPNNPQPQPQQQVQQQETPQPQAQQIQQQEENKQEAKAEKEKTYIFQEELVDPPIKDFTPETINENELLTADKQALQLYEKAVNEEKQPELINNPDKALKMWQDIANITNNNPFLNIAKKRAAEWKTCIEFFEKHRESFDKLSMFTASSILPSNQKTTLASKYLEEFGITFGTLEVEQLFQKLPDKDTITGDDVFKNMIKDVKQKRCDHNSGKDCYEFGENFTTMEYEKMMMRDKACELKYQPACTKQQEAKQQAKPQVQPQKTEEKAISYELAEDVIGLIKPCSLETLNAEILMNADTQNIQLFESTVNLEKQKETMRNPGNAIAAWEKMAKAEGNNPFKTIAGERISEWKSYIEKLGRHREDIAKITAMMADGAVTTEQKTDAAIKYLDESGINFGTLEIINAVAIQPDIKNNELFGTKITETRKKRCELDSGKDCQLYAEHHTSNETEKAEYLEKACKLEVSEACPNTVAQAPQAEQPQQQEEVAKEPAESENYEKEWRRLRNTRIAVATTTLVLGAAAAGLGGFSFYKMNKAKDKRDEFYDLYQNNLTDPVLVQEYRSKTEKQDKKYKKYMLLGSVGVGVGAALVATGIVLYSVEFKKEKKLKKNISFGMNPFDGNVYFTLNW